MSKLKRLRRKRALQKKANIREMSLRRNLSATVGPRKLMKRMTQDHQDVLQNIEFVLVTQYREDRSIDDRIIADALEAAIHGDTPEDTLAQSLNESLEGMREFRREISDETWRDCLRTVLQSVHRHSSLRPGSRGYLDFVSDFIL
jgi:uncharacterized alpha-E superfamily protein